MVSRIRLIILIACALACAVASGALEAYRIRIENERGGLVQVGFGDKFHTIGRVLHPANARIQGFAAASYADQGTVAAVAVHGIRIKTGSYATGIGKAQKPMIFSITPKQFSVIPHGYGGHIARSSGILTDIGAGVGIFREFSPFVGSGVYIRSDFHLSNIPDDYTPRGGEEFIISVEPPANPAREIVFENRAGGSVKSIFADGTERTIAKVDRPVSGTGRYDGTTFTGVGAVNTNHCGVLTISTAPVMPPDTIEGGEIETRGGFMVQPFFHAAEQGEMKGQVMVIGPADASKPSLEGTPPVFRGNIGLASFPQNPAQSVRAQVRIDGGDWEGVPEVVGRVDNSFTAEYLVDYFTKKGAARDVKQGVTAIRLLIPQPDYSFLQAELAKLSDAYAKKCADEFAAKSGSMAVGPKYKIRNGGMTTFAVDGEPAAATNERNASFSFNTRGYSNGLHTLTFKTTYPRSNPQTETRRVLVGN